jgi:hypothetical protein
MTRLWLAVVLMLVLICVARASSTALDEDNSYLAYLGAGPSAEAKAIEAGAVERAAAQSGCEELAWRISFRERYAANYTGYSALDQAIGRIGPRTPQTAVAAAIATKMLVFLCIALALVWAAARFKDQEKSIAVAGTIVALAALDWLAHTGALPLFGLSDVGHPLKAALHLAYGFVLADEPHSLFGLTPRNAALGLFAIALTLKWNDRPIAASLAMLAIAAVHQTYAGIALLFFFAATAVSRPAALKPMPARIVLLLCLALSILRDDYATDSVGVRVVAATALVGMGGAVMMFIQGASYQRLRERLTGRFKDEEILVDAAVMLVICVAVTLWALIFGHGAPRPVRLYFWSDLAIRVPSVARFPCFVALALILTRKLARPSHAMAGLTVAAVLLSVAVALQINATPQWSPANLDRNLASLRKGTLDFEGALYAHLLSVSVGAEPAEQASRILSSMPIGCDPPPA